MRDWVEGGLGAPAAGWRTSTHSTTARFPACLEAATGLLVNGVFIIDPVARATPVPVTTTPSAVVTTPRTTPPPGSQHVVQREAADAGAETTPPPGHTFAESGSQDTHRFGDGTAGTLKTTAVPRMPPAVLPDSLIIKADAFDAADLAKLAPESLRSSAERLIVIGLADVSEVNNAAKQLGIDVVARVDRVDSGQRAGTPWTIYSPQGRSTPVEVQGQFTAMSPVLKQVPSQLSESVFASSYPLFDKNNPGRANGGEYTTSCVLTAIATDQTLKEQGGRGDPDYGKLYSEVPPEKPWPRKDLKNDRGQAPVEVAGYYAIVNAVLTAGVGARGIVVVSVGGTEFDHAFNVVHDDTNGVVFLDGRPAAKPTCPPTSRACSSCPPATTSPTTPSTAARRRADTTPSSELSPPRSPTPTATRAPPQRAPPRPFPRRPTTNTGRPASQPPLPPPPATSSRWMWTSHRGRSIRAGRATCPAWRSPPPPTPM